MKDDPETNWYKEWRITEAALIEVERERDLYAKALNDMMDELMRMPRQSHRVENVVSRYRARVEWIETHGGQIAT